MSTERLSWKQAAGFAAAARWSDAAWLPCRGWRSHTRPVRFLPARVTRMAQFDVAATIDGEWAVLALGGEIDLAAGPAVRQCLHKLTDSGIRQVIVDLRRVTFLDSIGLGVLVGAYRRLRDAAEPGSLRLVCTNERVIEVFALTGLLALFPIPRQDR